MAESTGLARLIDGRSLSSRSIAFDWANVGASGLRIGALLDVVKRDPRWLPPRTGHIGNWGDITLGRSGALDFNKAICTNGYGYPLVHALTQTEGAGAEGERSGDWVYLPGSLVEGGRRTELPLLTWDGAQFVSRGRDRSYFCPFVQTAIDGELAPLVEVQWARLRGRPGFDVRLEAELIARNAAAARALLKALLEEAAGRDNPRRAFQDLIRLGAAKDGLISRCELRPAGKGFWLGGVLYADADRLAEAAMIPFLAAADPRAFFREIKDAPPCVPLISNHVTSILSAIFMSHCRDPLADGPGLAQPFNLHLHWGARDMAGYPPRRSGYFGQDSSLKSLRWMCAAIVSRFPEINPIAFGLLPAAAFMLCPSSAHPDDGALLSELFDSVRAARDGDSDDPGLALKAVEAAAGEWHARSSRSLSRYFRGRFGGRRGAIDAQDAPSESEPVEPGGFRELTFRQACMIVGALDGLEAGGAHAS